MNSRRMNRLEELGRVDAERARTRKGARNLKDEKKRIVRELKADGGYITKKKKPSWITKKETKPKYITKKKKYITKKSPAEIQDRERVGKAMGGSLKKVPTGNKGLKKLPKKVRNKMGFHKSGGRVGMGKALRGGGRVR